MIPSSVRCVLFDAVGTLIYPDPPVREVYAAAARESGYDVDESTVERRFARAFANIYNGPATIDVTSEAIERDRWRKVVAEVFFDFASSEAIFERLWAHFARPESWRVFDDVADCWRRLSDRGLALGIASNFDERLNTICRGLPPLDRCQQVFVSSRIGLRKPAGQFFRSIEQSLILAPQQLMLVGDDWQSDYLAATAAGWHAVYIQRAGNASHAASIRSLADLA